MLSLLQKKARLSYSVYTTFRRAIQLSSHGTNHTFDQCRDSLKYHTSSDEGRSVYSKKAARHQKMKGRLPVVKLHKRSPAEVDEVSDTFTDIESLDFCDKFGNLSNEDISQLRAGSLKKEVNDEGSAFVSGKENVYMKRGKKKDKSLRKEKSQYKRLEDVFGDLIADEGPTQGTTYSKFIAKNTEFQDDDLEKQHRPLKDQGKYEISWYTKKIKEFGEKGMIQEAIVVIEKWMLQNERVKPHLENFNELIHVLGRVGYTKKAFQMFALMRQMGVKPNKYTYASLFNACSNSPHPEMDGLSRAHKLWQHIQETNPKINTVVYQAMMKAFAKGKDMQTVLVIADFILKNYKRSVDRRDVLCFLLKAAQEDKRRGFLHAVAFWRMMSRETKDFKPNLYCYNQLLYIMRHCGIGSEEEFQKMLQETEYLGQFIEYSQLPRGHVEQRSSVFAVCETSDLQERKIEENTTTSVVLDVNQSHQQDSAETVKSSCIVPIDSKPRRNSHSIQDVCSTAQRKLIKDILSKSKVNEDMEWWEIAELEEKGQTNSLSKISLNLDPLLPPSDVVIEHNFPDLLNPIETMSSVTSMSEITTCIDRMNLLGGVKGFLIRMDMEGVAPDIRTIGQLLNFIPQTEEAEIALLRYMEDKRIRPDLELLNFLIWRRCERGSYAAAKLVLNLIYQYDMIPNLSTYTTLAKTCRSEKEVFNHLRNIQSAGMQPCVIVFMALIHLHWAVLNFPYKKRILMEMKRLDVNPDRFFLSAMEESNSKIRRHILHEEKQKKVKGFKGKQLYIEHEVEFEDFKTFYINWLQSVELQKKDGAWDTFKLSGPTTNQKSKPNILP